MLGERDTWRLCGLYAVTFGGFVGLSSFLPIFFHDQYGLSKVDAASLAAIGGAAGSFVRPFGGHLADRFGGTRVLTVVYGLAAPLLLLLSGMPSLTVGRDRLPDRDGRARPRQRRRRSSSSACASARGSASSPASSARPAASAASCCRSRSAGCTTAWAATAPG